MWWGRFSILCQWFAHLCILFSQRISGIYGVSDFSSTSSSVKRKDFSFCFFPCCRFAPPILSFFFFAFGTANFKSFLRLPVQRDPSGYCKIVNSEAWFGGYVNPSLEPWPCFEACGRMPAVINDPAHAASAAAPGRLPVPWWRCPVVAGQPRREGQSLELKNLWAIESIPEIGEVFLSLPLSLSYFEGIG